jgi:hypothetical protein
MEYKYPHFEIWSHYLNPIEIVYVLLWTYANDEKFTNIEEIDIPKSIEMDDEETHGDTELTIGVPLRKKEDEQTTLYMSYTYGGGYYGGSSGSYYDPPEPPTTYLNDLDIDSMMIYTGIDEIDITPEEVTKAKVDFTYKDLIYLATKIGINSVDAEELSASLQHDLNTVDGRSARNYPDPKHNVTAVPKMNFSPELKRKLDTTIKQKDVQTRISSNKFGL